MTVLPSQDSVDVHVSTTLSLLDRIFSGAGIQDFSVRLWDGTHWRPTGSRSSLFTLVLRHPGALRRMFWKASETRLGEAYIFGDFDVEGDFESVLTLGYQLIKERQTSTWEKLDVGRQLLRLPADGPKYLAERAPDLEGTEHSAGRDRKAVTYHYDVSNDFYKTWLDKRMIYSCAYFTTPEEDLDTAQRRKLDHICRKLRLKPGEKLLDIGCGWGGLILHAAQHYGVEATGITLSEAQAEEANQRIAAAGLSQRCRAELRDYRALQTEGQFDKVVSVGMVEHVGREQLPAYFGQAWGVLRPGGVFLSHGIGDTSMRPTKVKNEGFIRKYVFPDSDLPPLTKIVEEAEAARFEVRDVENLREHYTMTLRHWVRRLENNKASAREHVDETTYRLWRAYMSGCAWWFRAGFIGLYQVVMVKQNEEGASSLPLTRDDWYN